MQSELTNRVLECISLSYEDSTWDFKREWSHDKISLLHDILCMANQVGRESDGIIIIGVDEESDYAISGVQSDLNRKNTQEVTNLLCNANFAGDNRPEVKIENLKIEGKEVDVIVVKNSDRTPFFLSKEYCPGNRKEGFLRAGAVYTRVADTNTPIDKSADYEIVEALWEKRFGLDLPEIEKVHLYLKNPEMWKSVDGKESYYYSLDSRFRIITKLNREKTGKEYYCYSRTNRQPSWYDINIKCGETIIEENVGVYMDELFIAAPDSFMLDLQPFYYYIKNSFQYDLTRFFYSKMCKDSFNMYPIQYLKSCVPIFESTKEMNKFRNYLNDNIELLQKRIVTTNINRDLFPQGEYGNLDYRLYCIAVCASELLREMRAI